MCICHLALRTAGMSQSLKRLTFVSDDRGIAVLIPAETIDSSLLRSVPTDTGLDAVRRKNSFPGAVWPVRGTNRPPAHNAEPNEWRCTSLLLYTLKACAGTALRVAVRYRCTNCFFVISLPTVHKIRFHDPVVFNNSISILAPE